LTTVDPAALVTSAGRMAVQARIEDEGPPSYGLLVIEGPRHSWAALSEAPSGPDSSFLLYLEKVPAVIVAVVRGPCRGYAASVVARADLVIAAGSGSGTEDFPFLYRCDEEGVVDRLQYLARALEEQPRAAISTALLLRGSERRSEPAAFVAESATYAMLQGSGEFTTWLQSRSEGR